jgi:hypothetical protein
MDACAEYAKTSKNALRAIRAILDDPDVGHLALKGCFDLLLAFMLLNEVAILLATCAEEKRADTRKQLLLVCSKVNSLRVCLEKTAAVSADIHRLSREISAMR